MAGIVLKISIMDTHPPVWRRVVVPENISFLDLHRVIQVIFGWEDAHLHLFEAPRRLYAIVSDEEDAMEEAYLLEHRTQLRPVFEREKWVKYTYDFGDDWRHKILFEKRLPDEKTDVARVLKAKGNNFAEDSGGVWEQQPQQETYDVEQVNQRLEAMHLKNIRMSAADKQKLADIYLQKEWWKNLDKQLEQLLGESEQREEPLSPIEKESEEWDSFCGECLTGKVCVKMGSSSSRELLGRLGAQKAKVYCKYLQLSSNGQSTEQMLDAVAEELETHPEYNLYLLEKEDVAELKRLAAAAPDEMLTMSSDAVQKGLMLGLLQIQIPEGTEAASIFPAVDLTEKLTEFQSFTCKKCVRELADIAEKMEKLLAVYIVIELDAFYELFEKQWGMGLSKRDFLRYVYWYGVMGQNFETYFSEFTDICYVGIADLDIEQIHCAREVFAKDLPYKEFDRNIYFADFDEIVVYQEIWTDLASVLCDIFELDETALENIMGIFFQMVLSGDSIYDVYEVLTMFSIHMERELLAIDHVHLWQIFLHLMLETPLPMLNGYSRLEYEQVTGEAALATGIFQTDEEEDFTPETPLFALAPEWQAALAHAYLSNTGAAEIKAIEAVRKKLPAANYEMNAFLASECLDAGKQQKGLSILARLAEQTSDASIEAFLNAWEEYMMDEHAARGWQEELETEMPYRRETEKVGRNDPCPCGSGKKYKRCCGRK